MSATQPSLLNPDHYLERIESALHAGRSPKRAAGAQRFFKEPVKSLGWRTPDLRKFARSMSREIGDEATLVDVAEALFFSEKSNTHKILGVLLLERSVKKFGEKEFRRLVRWVSHITTWSSCDGLCLYLLAPLIAAEPARTKIVFRWAKSPNRWDKRGAAVSLIQCARRATSFREIFQLCDALLADEDDMVQKGVGWLLRELGKKNPERALPYLMRIKTRAPRLVLRTACEKLNNQQRRAILST
jgi:3-methyladenine DNA glycosylase AlkD